MAENQIFFYNVKAIFSNIVCIHKIKQTFINLLNNNTHFKLLFDFLKYTSKGKDRPFFKKCTQRSKRECVRGLFIQKFRMKISGSYKEKIQERSINKQKN